MSYSAVGFSRVQASTIPVHVPNAPGRSTLPATHPPPPLPLNEQCKYWSVRLPRLVASPDHPRPPTATVPRLPCHGPNGQCIPTPIRATFLHWRATRTTLVLVGDYTSVVATATRDMPGINITSGLCSNLRQLLTGQSLIVKIP